MWFRRQSACLVLLVLLFARVASPQVTTADIVGRVTDASGAVLPGATVTIENTATGAVRSQPTGETGDYVFNLLPIGTYTVRIELSGFQSSSARVTLASGDRARVDAKLSLGSIAENIQVTARGAAAADRYLHGGRAHHREGRAGSAGERAQHRAADSARPRRQ
jgi:hypothetical protein